MFVSPTGAILSLVSSRGAMKRQPGFSRLERVARLLDIPFAGRLAQRADVCLMGHTAYLEIEEFVTLDASFALMINDWYFLCLQTWEDDDEPPISAVFPEVSTQYAQLIPRKVNRVRST